MKAKIHNDNFQNSKKYNIPKVQLVITDMMVAGKNKYEFLNVLSKALKGGNQ